VGFSDPPDGHGPVIAHGQGRAVRQGRTVAVIGGGASGTLAAVHLLRSATAQRYQLRVVVIDRYGRHGLGQAYSTTHPAHLLNATAGQMSALAGDPDHLVRWAGPAAAGGSRFLARQLYGRYLRDTLAQAEQQAQQLARLIRVTSEVVAVRRVRGRLRLLLDGGPAGGSAGGPASVPAGESAGVPAGESAGPGCIDAVGCIDADVAILAIGNLPGALPFPVPDSPRIIADPWAPGALDGTADGSPVVIVGTGLTMMDLAVAVTGSSPRTVVHAVSRHGLLPRPHRELSAARNPVWLPVLSETADPVRLTELIWQVRSAMAASPNGWQQVVDALRPSVPGLWHRMPVRDKRMFLRHVARYWEVHRHRVPPATARRIAELRCTGRLSVLEGRVTGVAERAGQVRVRIARDSRTAQDGSSTELTAGWLINGTGAATDITRTADPLLRDLFASGLARPDPVRLGLDASTDGAVLDASGAPSSTLFTLGPPLRGLWYETTAIPEIRQQAAALASRLTAEFQARERPGSAA
jgi:uncharacterized NAD(P)/FAD-binding protein YdhS